MAVIADEFPTQEKGAPADIATIINESPAQEEGFSLDKSKKVFQPCDTDHDLDKKPLPSPEFTTEPPSALPVQQGRKKRRQRKRKRKKIKAVVVIKRPRTGSGIVSRKFRLKLPKRVIGNRLLLIALCSLLHLAHSALSCMMSVPELDVPIIHKHNDQNFIFQKPSFCLEKVNIYGYCAACFKENSPQIICSDMVFIDTWVQGQKGDGYKTLISMASEDCKHVAKKSHEHRMKGSEELNLDVEPKVSKRSVEEKNEDVTPIRNDDVSRRSVEEKNEDTTQIRNDDEICNISVPVTDFPIVINKDGHHYTFTETIFCPKTVNILQNCSACFKNQSLLKISYRKNGDADYGSFWVEHGKKQGLSSHVEMNSEVCHKIVKNASQSDQSDGGTSTENFAASKATRLRGPGLFLILL